MKMQSMGWVIVSAALTILTGCPEATPAASDTGFDSGPGPTDTGPNDTGFDSGVHPDATVTDTGIVGDDSGLRLLKGGFETAAPAPGDGTGLRLIEGGFEGTARTCAGTLCVTGGITP